MLAGLGLDFRVEAADIDEQVLPGESPEALVVRVATEKARVVAQRHPGHMVLAADTVVVLEGTILGKPVDAEEAVGMLTRLSGRGHEVWTGFCLARAGREEGQVCRAVRTEVCFAQLSAAVIRAYVSTGDPLDKAGGYGIQSLGGFMVASISGSYSNVVGLPLAEVLAVLSDAGLIQGGSTEEGCSPLR
jgi:septum formation protein